MFGGDAQADNAEAETKQEKKTGKKDSADDELILPEVKAAKEEAKKVDRSKKIPLVVQSVMQDVIGMEEVAEALRDLKNRYEMQQKRSSFAKTDEFSHCVAIYGKPGIGVTTAAQRVGLCLYKLGIVANPVPVTATYEDIVKKDEQETVNAIQTLFQSAMNGVLIIDEFHRFQDDNELAAGMQAVDLLLKAYEDSRHQVALIIAGYGKEMKQLMEAKPRFARVFVSNSIEMVGYSAGEYVQILHSIAEDRGYVIDDLANPALERNIKGMMKLPNFKHIYYLLDELLDPAITDAANKASAKRRTTADDYTIIKQENFILNESPKSLEELLEELNSLTGLETVKRQINELIKKMETVQKAEKEGKEYMDILKKQGISAMSDEQIKRLIARESIQGDAAGMEDVISLRVFMDSGNTEAEEEPVSAQEQALIEEMSEEDVVDFLEMLNASFSETIAQEELKLKEALVELDKKAIDESYLLARCPIYPAHDIHILPKGKHLYFCHLANKKLSPVFEEAKRLLFSGEASMVHVYQGCAFVINAQGDVTKRIDVVDEPMELVIRNGWEELP